MSFQISLQERTKSDAIAAVTAANLPPPVQDFLYSAITNLDPGGGDYSIIIQASGHLDQMNDIAPGGGSSMVIMVRRTFPMA